WTRPYGARRAIRRRCVSATCTVTTRPPPASRRNRASTSERKPERRCPTRRRGLVGQLLHPSSRDR
ncbi:MAG: hypothetical protein AVDCRST_MAG79-1608, partial [uncultured Thermoleophilia bacterium]